jgi:gliding motility-associated-like protein
MFVNVLAKAPIWDSIVPSFDSINLFWQNINDENVKGYKIYRRKYYSGLTQDSCQYGMTDSSYKLLIDLPNKLTNSYTDKSNLEKSSNYCYRIIAYLNNKTESQMSDEICAELKSNVAVITKIDVVETDTLTGKIEIQWRKPLDLDISSPEYKYVLHTKYNSNEEVVDTIYNTNDTNYLHQNLNTRDFQYLYSVEIVDCSKTRYSSSIFLSATPRNKKALLQWNSNTAWINDEYHIYKLDKLTGFFDSIGISFENQYIDDHLDNDTTYYYKVRSIGSYHTLKFPEELTMFSNEIYCTPALDTPCQPIWDILNINTNCKPAQVKLAWNLDDDCGTEGILYHIYYAKDSTGTYYEIDSTNNLSFFYTLENLYGCFYIIPSNENGIVGQQSEIYCLNYESCMNYELPNIFTPNSDGINDFFLALDNDFTGVFEIVIYNRWGNVVFQSKDPAFEWDGVNIQTKQPCPDGTYYYICNLSFYGAENQTRKILKGFVTILR